MNGVAILEKRRPGSSKQGCLACRPPLQESPGPVERMPNAKPFMSERAGGLPALACCPSTQEEVGKASG